MTDFEEDENDDDVVDDAVFFFISITTSALIPSYSSTIAVKKLAVVIEIGVVVVFCFL